MFTYNKSKILLFTIFLWFSTASAYQLPGTVAYYFQKITGFLKPQPQEPKFSIAFMSIGDDIKDAKSVIRNLLELQANPFVLGLIIHIDSNGGHVGTSQAIFSQLKKFSQIKPTVVIIENYCLSGGYYIAVAANYIFALPSSEIGSIGVIRTISHYKDLKFKDNNNTISGALIPLVLKIGKYKDSGNPYTETTQEQIDRMQDIGLKIYNQFVSDVAEARNLSIEDEKIYGDGQTFVGTDALQLKLIDAIGDFTDALEKMKELLTKRNSVVPDDFEIIEVQL
jgi:protease IV